MITSDKWKAHKVAGRRGTLLGLITSLACAKTPVFAHERQGKRTVEENDLLRDMGFEKRAKDPETTGGLAARHEAISDLGNFIYLVPRAPTNIELQAALDAQDFVSRLMISRDLPFQVQSEGPPLYEWRGRLDGKDLAFRIGVTEPSRLPGRGRFDADVLRWPVVLWSTRDGEPDVVGASAMALYAWAAALGGVAYTDNPDRYISPIGTKLPIDLILTYASHDWVKLRLRYPDVRFPGSSLPLPRSGEGTISIYVR